MEKQTALITGANKGISLETARQLARAGYRVFLGSRDRSNGDKAVAQLQSEGLEAVELLLIDVADERSVQQAHDDLATRINKPDVLVNNAGIPGSLPQAPSTAADDNPKKVFEVNFFGAIRTVRVFMDLLRKAPLPRIVNGNFRPGIAHPAQRPVVGVLSFQNGRLRSVEDRLERLYRGTGF